MANRLRVTFSQNDVKRHCQDFRKSPEHCSVRDRQGASPGGSVALGCEEEGI